MNASAEQLIRKFFRTYPDVFTPKEFLKFLNHLGIKSSVDEARDYLECAENVFYLDENHFQTRAGVFGGRFFSFKPSRKEIDKGVFIPGDRCMPFVDPDYLSCGLNFFYKGKKLPQKIETFDSDFVLDLFTLYGEEFSIQYIAADPVNRDKMNLADFDFFLPNEIQVTAISLEPLLKDGLSANDRILCRLLDWDDGEVELKIDRHIENPFQVTEMDMARNKWYENLENYMLDSLDYLGPRNSIEEQLAYIFFTGAEVFCEEDCGSLSEFFARSKKIGIEPFGVESRIWRKGEDVPAIGEWNRPIIDESAKTVRFGQYQPLIPLHEAISVSFIKDMIYSNSDDFAELMEKMYPCQEYYSAEQKNRMLLHLKSRHDILFQNYNRFADSQIAEIRHETLELYAIVNELVCLIDIEGNDLDAYPQQPLVILSQIYGHVTHLLEMMEEDSESVINEMDEIELSLEGMRFNFECVSEELKTAIDKESKNGFKIVK